MTPKLTAGKTDWLSLLLGLLALLIGGSTGMLVVETPSSLKLLVMLIGLFFVLATLIRAEWGMLGLAVINYTNLSDVAIRYHGLPSIAQPFIVLVIFAILVRWRSYVVRPEGWQTPLLLVGAYTLAGASSLLYASDPIRAQNEIISYLKYPIVMIIVTIVLQRGEQLRRMVWTLLLVGIFLGTISSYQYLTGTFDNNYGGFAVKPFVNITEEGDAESRVTGPIGDPNFYAQTMVVIVPLALAQLLNERSRLLKLLAFWSLAACIMTVLGTLSRGAFLGLGVVCAMRLLRPPFKPSMLVPIVAAAIIVLIPLAPLIPERYTNRLGTMTEFISGPSEDGQQDHSLRGRSSEMLAAVMMFSDNPILGVGLGNYNSQYLKYSRILGMDSRREERSAHSLYLEIAAERGLVGLTIFGALIFVMFRTMLQARRTLYAIGLPAYGAMVDALTIGMTSYMTTSLFLHDAYPRYFWLLIGIAFATNQVAQNELAAQQSGADNKQVLEPYVGPAVAGSEG